MARIKFFRVVEHFEDDITPALEDAVRDAAPNANIDRRTLFQAFSRAIDNRFALWSRVPDKYVELIDDR